MSYYPVRIVKDPTLIINSNEIIKGNLEVNEIDLVSGGNLDVSTLSIDNIEIIDATRNIKSINLINADALESNTLNYFQSITLEDVVGNGLAILDKHGNGSSAKLEIYDTSTGTPIRRVYLSSNPAQNSYIKNPFTFSETNTGTDASSQLEVHSTTKGFLPPRMTQTQKLAISSPATGLEVYDTTSKCKSYFNSVNWFIPSYISFKNTTTDATPSSIEWDVTHVSADARISFNNLVGIFTLSDVGVYEVHCIANFYITATGSTERNIILDFRESGSATVLASSNSNLNLGVFGETGSTYANCSINYILNATSVLDYSFNFSSQTGNTIDLNINGHGYIKRIL